MSRAPIAVAVLGTLAIAIALTACASVESSTTRDDGATIAYAPVARRIPDRRDDAPAPSMKCAAYAPIVRDVGDALGVDPGLIAGVATVESRWHPRAHSRAGARGLMQIMPATGKHLDCGDLFTPEDNLRCGALLLQRLLARYDGRVDFALAAYALGARAPDRAYANGERAPRQPFIDRVLAAKKAWVTHGCRT